jgi:nucleotide-binding universal stress UspA family protein
MASQKILLPYNFTSYDEKALDFVIRTFAHLKDTEITLFNAHISVPAIELKESPVMEKMRGNLIYLSQQVKEQEGALNKARDKMIQSGFSEKQIRCMFKPRLKDVASEIIKLATKEHFDLVVMNHKPGAIKQFFTGSVHGKVVAALKDTTVCIVS